MFPPNKPRYPLKNYLLNLRDNIKIADISTLLQEWHSCNFSSYLIASKTLGISESFYREIIQGLRYLPIWILKRLAKYDSLLTDVIYTSNPHFTGRNHKEILPFFINPKLAYYVGYLHGDGHIEKTGSGVSFSEKYISQLNIINSLTKKLFHCNGSIFVRMSRINEPYYRLQIRRITINSFFSDVIGIKKGKRYHNKIPFVIKEYKELLRWYLCGLFDAEGSMPLNPKSRRNLYIDIAMKDINLISEIKDLLEGVFNIKPYGPYKRIAKSPMAKSVTFESELKIRKYSEIRKFLNTIGTIHPDKVRRMKLILRLLGP